MPEKTRKTAVLFDVDDTLYDQTVPFKEAYAEYFGAEPAVPADVIYPVTRKYSDRVYSRAMAGEITMEEMYIYRVQKAFDEFDIFITDKEALDFQKIYADRQRHIHMSPLMEEILSFCSEKAELGIITNGPSAHQWNKSEKPSGGEVDPSREYLRIRGCGGGETGEEDIRLREAGDGTGGY